MRLIGENVRGHGRVRQYRRRFKDQTIPGPSPMEQRYADACPSRHQLLSRDMSAQVGIHYLSNLA
jgi:hypothetical protein